MNAADKAKLRQDELVKMRQAVVAVIPENDKELIGVGGNRQISLNPFATESPIEVSQSSEPSPAPEAEFIGATLPIADQTGEPAGRPASTQPRPPNSRLSGLPLIPPGSAI